MVLLSTRVGLVGVLENIHCMTRKIRHTAECVGDMTCLLNWLLLLSYFVRVPFLCATLEDGKSLENLVQTLEQQVAHPRRFNVSVLKSMSPDNAWMVKIVCVYMITWHTFLNSSCSVQIVQGIETLSLRMERHCENSLKVARHLDTHPDVAWVRYPGLPSDPQYEKAQKYLKGTGKCQYNEWL